MPLRAHHQASSEFRSSTSFFSASLYIDQPIHVRRTVATQYVYVGLRCMQLYGPNRPNVLLPRCPFELEHPFINVAEASTSARARNGHGRGVERDAPRGTSDLMIDPTPYAGLDEVRSIICVARMRSRTARVHSQRESINCSEDGIKWRGVVCIDHPRRRSPRRLSGSPLHDVGRRTCMYMCVCVYACLCICMLMHMHAYPYACMHA